MSREKCTRCGNPGDLGLHPRNSYLICAQCATKELKDIYDRMDRLLNDSVFYKNEMNDWKRTAMNLSAALEKNK